MKKIFLALLVLAVLACKQEPKDYVTLSGQILNANESKLLTVLQGKKYKKDIVLNEDGTFKDTLKIEEGVYYFKHGEEYGQVYLKNDNETSLFLDNENFDASLKFKGDDSDKSNFIIANLLLSQDHLTVDLFDSAEEDFNKAISNLKNDFTDLVSGYPDLGEDFIKEEEKNLESLIQSYSEYYQSKLAMRKEFPAGTTSPQFVNYENFKGGTTSLSDLKGKYVYIDVWATWCGPCKREIPSLKKLEETYHDKNIAFVSISVDDAKRSGTMEKANADWKKMVSEKELTGVQLFSDNAWKSEFIQAYKIRGIPRFILIDPQGKIVNADAPRPSSSALIELFDSLNI